MELPAQDELWWRYFGADADEQQKGTAVRLDEIPRTSAYAEDAHLYDRRTSRFNPWRRRLVELLALRRGDVVFDLGCGTGLCFPLLEQRVGPDGVIFGVDASREMLALAETRVAEHGWQNVVLLDAAVERVELPRLADHALFCAVHDILRSPEAVRNVIAQLRPGSSVAAGGGKWAPPWALALNLVILSTHEPFVRDFAGFDRPWAGLVPHLADLKVSDVAMGGGYLAVGRTPG